MPFASGARVTLHTVKETVYGVTPANPAYKAFRTTEFDATPTYESEESPEISGDRQIESDVIVSASNGGSIGLVLSPDSHDDMLEAVLMSEDWKDFGSIAETDVSFTAPNTMTKTGAAWATAGVLPETCFRVSGSAANSKIFIVKGISGDDLIFQEAVTTEAPGPAITLESMMITNGITDRSFTTEDYNGDVDKYLTSVGIRYGKLNLSAPANQIVTGSVTVLGSAATTAQVGGTPTYTAAPAKEVFNSTTNLRRLEILKLNDNGDHDAALSFVTKNLEIEHDNQLEEQTAVGSLFAAGVAARSIASKLTLELYFQDYTVLDHMIAGDRLTARYAFTNTSNDIDGDWLLFSQPSCKVSEFNKPTPGKDNDVMANITLKPIKDPILSGKTIIITKFSAA